MPTALDMIRDGRKRLAGELKKIDRAIRALFVTRGGGCLTTGYAPATVLQRRCWPYSNSSPRLVFARPPRQPPHVLY